jgi:AcrR family transcriptional regulator
MQKSHPKRRQRLSREERHRQLLDVAWLLIRNKGTEALSLGSLAEAANITKPVVYDHFGTRSGLLAALYKDFDARQTVLIDASLRSSEPDLARRASVIAACYVDCVLSQGCEIPGVIAALTGSPELEQIKHEYEAVFMEKCHVALAPFVGERSIAPAGLRAMVGAAEALSRAAVTDQITADQAKDELFDVIVSLVERSARKASRGRGSGTG